MAIDTSYQALNQEQQGGAALEIGGSLNIDVGNGGQLKINDVQMPLQVGISAAAGSTNIALVTFQAKDGAGNNVAKPVVMDIWLSDAAAGGALTATSASGAVAAGASGTDLSAMVAKKAIRVLTDATGKYILSITDTAKTGFYPCCQLPNGVVTVGTQLVTGNYG